MSEIQQTFQEFADEIDAALRFPEPVLDVAEVKASLEAARARRPLNKPEWSKDEGHKRVTRSVSKPPAGSIKWSKGRVVAAQSEAERAPTFFGGHRHFGPHPLLALPLPAGWSRRA